ncbi:DUF2075 domain-containing protein [Veillonella parvula]|jgi:DUF2075 family protein|uniref:DUF2075 domain-containing protein n=1 Tax=Veillonella parvula TaxID=29466 RepID=UPI00241E2016|nr:DUF2075 domain-containing protein [Veillonella parvula]
MIIYSSTKQSFIQDFEQGVLVKKLHQTLTEKYRRVGESEIHSWQTSLSYMANVMRDIAIPDLAGVAIEYIVPNTQKRVDFIITGLDQHNKEHVIIVELKQWGEAFKVADKDNIVSTYLRGGLHEVTHPSYQAWSYCSLIENFNEDVQTRPIELHPCAFLHNFDESISTELRDSIYSAILDISPMFTLGQMNNLRNFIKTYIPKPDTTNIIESIEHGRLRPSKALQDSILSMLKGNKEFVLIDDQKIEFERIKKAALDAIKNNQKTVYIVRGGPGTGKSVVAINLLAECIHNGYIAQYITSNAAPRNVYSTMLQKGFKKTEIKALFQGSGTFHTRSKNALQIAIVDEAHRLREKSGMYQNEGEDQIKEIINASLFSVFFIDRNQRVTFKDAGTIDKILKFSTEQKALVYEGALESQFRCNGSDGYLAWLDNVLQIAETANYDGFEGDYDFRIFDDPNAMYAAIKAKNEINNKSRVLAGYCWDWPKEGRTTSLVKDIQILEHNFGISWNLENSTTYAIDPDSINEAGCIHTTQGLEFEYVGVIIGDDLRYENDKLIVDINKRAKTDQSIKGIKKLLKENPEEGHRIANEIVKNTYRTLMTRGQKGCYIYCTNKDLANYFKLAYNHQLSYTYDESQVVLATQPMAADKTSSNTTK